MSGVGRINSYCLCTPWGGETLDGAVRTYPSPQEQRRRQQKRCVVVDCHGTAVAWLQPTIGTAASQRFVDRLVDAAGCSCGVCTHPPAAAVQQAPHVVPTVSHFQKKIGKLSSEVFLRVVSEYKAVSSGDGGLGFACCLPVLRTRKPPVAPSRARVPVAWHRDGRVVVGGAAGPGWLVGDWWC